MRVEHKNRELESRSVLIADVCQRCAACIRIIRTKNSRVCKCLVNVCARDAHRVQEKETRKKELLCVSCKCMFKVRVEYKSHEFESRCVCRASECQRCASCARTTSWKARDCVVQVRVKGARRAE